MKLRKREKLVRVEGSAVGVEGSKCRGRTGHSDGEGARQQEDVKRRGALVGSSQSRDEEVAGGSRGDAADPTERRLPDAAIGCEKARPSIRSLGRKAR